MRLSGPACRQILLLHLGKAQPLSRHVYYGAFRSQAKSVLDRLNFVFFSGPASSTGEDVLELYPHGNMLIVDGILKSILEQSGVRLAEAGEFTRRSFENGKVDLLQAEAVGELIHAQTAEALKNAQRIVGGELSGPLKALRESLLDLSARLELDVDFSEEEADPDFSSWIPRIQGVLATLDKLASGFEKGRSLARSPRVAILGAPNAGKSSLINALVEEDRLLVSNIPGTTRDYVDVPLNLPGGMIHLVDTAGLGKPVDGLDELAMERTRSQLEKADFRIWIEDGVLGGGEVLDANAFSLRIQTKLDLPGFQSKDGFLGLSNRTHVGINAMRENLNALVFGGGGISGDILLTTERQFRAVDEARNRVKAALAEMELRKRPAIEIIAFEIREASDQLRELLGEISSDEVLVKIFLGFCIGK